MRRTLSGTVSRTAARPVRVSGKRSAQRPKGAEARGIAEEIGAKRRLERKARPRSGSPELDVVILALVSIIISTSIISTSGGTVVFTVCAIAVSFGVTSTSTGGG